jgi:hypothetical protein
MGQEQQGNAGGGQVPPEHRDELCRRCIPQVESILGGAGGGADAGAQSAPSSPHIQQFAIPPAAAQFLVNLVAQYGPALAQQALDLIKAELGKLTNAPTAQPGV